MPKNKTAKATEQDGEGHGSAVNLRSQIEKLGAILAKKENLRGDFSLSTGILPLDLILTPEGGFRSGCAEIYGPESVGKTSLALSILRSAKKQGAPALLIDVESAMTNEMCAIFGLEPNVDFLLEQTDNAEAALNTCELFIRNTKKSVVILDSIADLLSKGEMEESVEERSYNPVSLMLSKLAKKAQHLCRRSDSLLIYLNQIRANMDKYGPDTRVPGPWAIKYNISWRIEVKKEGLIKESGDQGEVIGQKVSMKTVKNRSMRPYQKAQSTLIFGKGFHQGYDLILLAATFGLKSLVRQDAAWFHFFNGEKIQGMAKAADYVMDNSEVQEKIREGILEICRQ